MILKENFKQNLLTFMQNSNGKRHYHTLKRTGAAGAIQFSGVTTLESSKQDSFIAQLHIGTATCNTVFLSYYLYTVPRMVIKHPVGLSEESLRPRWFSFYCSKSIGFKHLFKQGEPVQSKITYMIHLLGKCNSFWLVGIFFLMCVFSWTVVYFKLPLC